MGKTYRRNSLNPHNIGLMALAEHKAKTRYRIHGMTLYDLNENFEKAFGQEYEWIVCQGDDRKWKESHKNGYFKYLSKKERRISDRENYNEVLKAVDADAIDDLELDWQTDRHGKHYIWSVW